MLISYSPTYGLYESESITASAVTSTVSVVSSLTLRRVAVTTMPSEVNSSPTSNSVFAFVVSTAMLTSSYPLVSVPLTQPEASDNARTKANTTESTTLSFFIIFLQLKIIMEQRAALLPLYA